MATASHITGVIDISCCDESFSLMEKLAEYFMDKYPRIQVFIDNTETEIAIEKLKKGQADIVITTNYINFRNTSPKLLAKDGIVFIINSQNDIDNLSLDKLQKIYTGDILTWNNLGLNAVLSRKIERFGLNDVIKTRHLFQELYVPFKIDDTIKNFNTEIDIIEAVKGNKYAIGYISLSSYLEFSGDEIKPVGIDSIYPSLDNVITNIYQPIKTYYYVTETEPYGVIKLFIDWIKNSKSFSQYGLINY